MTEMKRHLLGKTIGWLEKCLMYMVKVQLVEINTYELH